MHGAASKCQGFSPSVGWSEQPSCCLKSRSWPRTPLLQLKFNRETYYIMHGKTIGHRYQESRNRNSNRSIGTNTTHNGTHKPNKTSNSNAHYLKSLHTQSCLIISDHYPHSLVSSAPVLLRFPSPLGILSCPPI